MVRLAIESDAEQLEILNNEFNGEGETSLENIKYSLIHNQQEFVVIKEIDNLLVGFICVQLKNLLQYFYPVVKNNWVNFTYIKFSLN